MANLKLGSGGPEVKRLQEALNRKLKPSPNLVPDGAYGNLTRNAVLRFQREQLARRGRGGRAGDAGLRLRH